MKIRLLRIRANAFRHRSERGATATEYGLLVLFIALALTLGVTAFGTGVNTLYDRLATVVTTF